MRRIGRSGSEAWQKIKVVQKGKFPLVGFIKDPSGVAALYLGEREGKDLVYMGKGRHGVEPNHIGADPQRTRYRHEPEAEADQDHQEAKGHVGRAQILCRHRVPRHHLGRSSAHQLVQGAEQRNAAFLGAFSSLNQLLDVLDEKPVVQAVEELKMEKPTAEQLAELKRLSAIARVPDESEIVTSKEEAEIRIRDLKDKARME